MESERSAVIKISQQMKPRLKLGDSLNMFRRPSKVYFYEYQSAKLTERCRSIYLLKSWI